MIVILNEFYICVPDFTVKKPSDHPGCQDHRHVAAPVAAVSGPCGGRAAHGAAPRSATRPRSDGPAMLRWARPASSPKLRSWGEIQPVFDEKKGAK